MPHARPLKLVCSHCGGPEKPTAPSLADTRLLVSSKELFQLLRCAEAASDHVRDGHLRTQLQDSRDYIFATAGVPQNLFR